MPEEEAVSPSPPARPSQPVQPPQETAPPFEEISPPAEIPPVVLPIELSLDVKNPDKTAYDGKDLNTELNIKNPDGIKKELEISYTIYDSRDNIFTTEEEKITLEKDGDIAKAIKIPRLANPGRYRVEAKIRYGDHVISADSFFEIKEVPILNFGAGITLTLTQIMQKISWVILVLLSCL